MSAPAWVDVLAAQVREAIGLTEARYPLVKIPAALAALNALVECVTEWMQPFAGSGREWHEGMPSPYTYQASDFSKLVAAVHEYEAALADARNALAEVADGLAAWWRGDTEDVPRPGVIDEVLARLDGGRDE